MFEDPFRALRKARNDLKTKAINALFVSLTAITVGIQPVAAQSGDLGQLTSLMNQLADLLQRLGLAVAVVGLSVAGIAYMAHKPRTAKSIAQNVIIGTIILLLSGAAIDYISAGL